MSKEYRDKLKSVGILKGGQTKARVIDSRDENGDRTKAVTDELGNTITEHNNSLDQVDVMIRPKTVDLDISLNK
jgi:hypothetical protein